MNIHFNDTQPAAASADTLFDVITDYGHYPRFNSHVKAVKVVSQDQRGAEFIAGRDTKVEKDAHAYDRYERNGDLVVERTYGGGTDARSTWTIHAVDGDHSTLNIDASMTMPWWKGVVMKPFLRKIFYGINFTPFIREAERRATSATAA
jgi:ribosome-associated toxin RatA of RatAB toxin-antitoxin module